MYIESSFYQLTGYRAHSNKWFPHKKFDDKPLVEAIFSTPSKIFRPGGRDSPIELVLGILPSGASYLLMSHEQMLEFTLKHRQVIPRDSWKADDFLSLSPIYFNSPEELAKKFATYKQRPRNKNRRDHEEAPLDNSAANRGYVQSGTNIVHFRAEVEQQRILYRLLTRELEPGKIGLAVPSWLSCVRVVSLVIGEWNVENRRRDERLKDPRIVEVGWTDALFPPFFEKLEGSTIYLQLDTGIRNPGTKNPYYSEIVKAKKEELYPRLRALLEHDANKSGIPLIVLVHDEEMARSVLSLAGIDATSWPSGLSKLLPIVSAKSEKRGVLSEHYIVDMQKLVKTLMATVPGNNVPQSAKVLRMQTETKTCAGDDSLLQLRMWLSMAQGLAIDEQYKERSNHLPDCAYVLPPPAHAQQHVEEEDLGDIDPNDMAPAPRPNIIDDFSDDDW